MAVTIQIINQWKQKGRSIISLTAWDYSIARVLDEAGVDLIMVGDSLGMVALGHTTTLPVTLDNMIYHAAAVCRGVERALVVGDLPFMSYQESTPQAIHSAGRMLKEGGVGAVKLEGGHSRTLEAIAELTAIGIPVMGHIGLTPQSVRRLGFKQQGQTQEAAKRILDEAIAVANAGAFAIVLEHIPSELAATITAKVTIPTIGIGAGNQCDGQVLVTADFLGLTEKSPPFAKSYLNLKQAITDAVKDYTTEVKEGKFPQAEDK